MDSANSIKVKGNDGEVIEISAEACKRSGVLKGMMEDYSEDKEFTINDVNSKVLLKVKEYLEHYATTEPEAIEIPLKSVNFKECVSEWDYNYLGEDTDEILSILLASNFMDIKPLLELASAKFGSIVKVITTEHIVKSFQIDVAGFEEKENNQISQYKDTLRNLNI